MPTAAPRSPARPYEPPRQDADERRRMTFYLTDEQRARFLAGMARAGHRYVSDYLVDALALDAEREGAA